MFHYKKIINSDLLQLAIIVSLLRLDFDAYLGWDNTLDSHDVFLGTNLAYSPTQYHYLHHTYNGYIHPKNIDSVLYDRFSIFAELNSLGRYSRFRPLTNNIFAYLVDQEETKSQNSQEQSVSNNDDNPSESMNLRNEEHESDRNETVNEVRSDSNRPTESHGNSHVLSPSISSELSFEDMNLIEILWKQDIDLGITKDAFDYRPNVEVSKSKQVEETLKSNKDPPKEAQIQLPSFDPWEGVDYKIDGETGEHILLENNNHHCVTNSEDCTFNDLDLQQLADDLQNVPLDETLLLFNEEKLEDVSTPNVQSDVTELTCSFQEMGYENFSSDNNVTFTDVNADSLFDQLCELNSLLDKTVENNVDNQVNERYSSHVDNRWQNFTTALTYPPSTSTNQSLVPQQIRRSNLIVPDDNGLLSNVSNMSTNFSDIFPDVLLQNTTLTSSLPYSYPETDRNIVNNTVPSSFAALSNHTDPTAENVMNITYDQNFPELFCQNNISNPDFLTNLLFDEDLELMDMSCNEDNCDVPLKSTEYHAETTSDSAVSSMDSDKSSYDSDYMDSASDSSSVYNDNYGKQSSFMPNINNSSNHPPTAQKKYKLFGKKTNFHKQNGNDNHDYKKQDGGKNSKHFDFGKQNTNDSDDNFNHLTSKEAGCGKLKMLQCETDITRNIDQHIHHNHTYNMPFEKANMNQKPITRDKDSCSSLEISSKDERRAKILKIPISTEDIIHLPIDEFNEKLSKYDLREEQLSLIRDIRRRGKNKVAAQNCRKRKLGQIVGLQQELESLLEEKAQLQTEQEEMLSYRQMVKDKYNQLYNFISQSTSSNPQPPRPPDFSHQLNVNQRDNNIGIPSNATTLSINSDVDSSKGARSKRKVNRK